MLKQKIFRTGKLGFFLLFIIAGNSQQELNSSASGFSGITADTLFSAKPAFATYNTGLNKAALQFIKTYLKGNAPSLAKLEKRNKACLATIDAIFAKYDIPLELKYLAIIESGLQTSLVNNSGATGIWQIMPETAHGIGLKITDKYDPRFNVYQSTVAIAGYLKQLYAQYKDWLLVVAAYNTGPGNVNRAIRRSGSRDFWKLQSHLATETQNHVKRYISVRYYFEEQNFLATQAKTEERQIAKVKPASNSVSNN